jgi:hypothetical protein
MSKPKISSDGRTITVQVPISIRKRGGRRFMLAPDSMDITTSPIHRHIDNAMVKAIARAFRWREMLENGHYSTIREIAAAEKINETYIGRVLRRRIDESVSSRLAGPVEILRALNLKGVNVLPSKWQRDRQPDVLCANTVQTNRAPTVAAASRTMTNCANKASV